MSDVIVELYKRRLLRLASFCTKEVSKLQNRPYSLPFSQMRAKTRNAYITLAEFLIVNNLHPRLYLRVMHEFSVNFYPNVLSSPTALGKYQDYIQKIRDRYKDLKMFKSSADPSFNILRNDLYLLASCDPAYTPSQFYMDGDNGVMNGWERLRSSLHLFEEHIDAKTLVIVKNLLKCRSVAQSKYAELVGEASHVN